jgi:hypothetical protein
LAKLKLLYKYLMPKIKINEKLFNLREKNQIQFIYILCPHRSSNPSFRASCSPSLTLYASQNPHYYTNVKKFASEISDFVADIPAVSTVFSAV